MSGQPFVIAPGDADRDWQVTRLVVRAVKQAGVRARDTGKPQEIVIREKQRVRSDPQRNTFWMWHAEVASELSVRTAMVWSKDDVHELIFLKRFMPRREFIDPQTGEVLTRPVRTSDKSGPDDDDRTMREIITDAMEDYLAWICDMGITVTVPESGW